MTLLLDTHVLLWCLSGDRSLKRASADLILDPANDVLFSAASIWELTIKVARGKMRANTDRGPVWPGPPVRSASFRFSPVTPPRLARCPPHHRDPFDRLLLAQSRAESLQLMTSDAVLERYGENVMLVQ